MEKKPGKTWRCMLIRLLILLVSAYGLIVLLGWWGQEFLVFPGAIIGRGTAAAPGRGHVMLPTAEGPKVGVYYAPANDAPVVAGTPKPLTVIFFYGNGENMQRAEPLYDFFRCHNVNVVGVDYLGYGVSDGKPSEAGCYAAAEVAWDFALKQPQVDPNRIVIIGWSLGSGVATELALRKQPAGLVLFSAFTSMADAAKSRYGFLPIDLLLRHRFDNASKLSQMRMPLMLIHGQEDNLVPFRMQAELAKIRPDAQVVVLPGTGHNDVFYTQQRQLNSALRGYFAEILQTHPPGVGTRVPQP